MAKDFQMAGQGCPLRQHLLLIGCVCSNLHHGGGNALIANSGNLENKARWVGAANLALFAESLLLSIAAILTLL